MKWVMALLAHGGQVATDGGGVLGAIPTAKAARDLLLHLEHTQVALGQVVVKGHVEIIEERQNLGALLVKPLGQIAGFRLFGEAVCVAAWPALRRDRIGGKGVVGDALIRCGQFLMSSCAGVSAVAPSVRAVATAALLVTRKSRMSAAQACWNSSAM